LFSCSAFVLYPCFCLLSLLYKTHNINNHLDFRLSPWNEY
jgi:hypothetical protein